MAVHVNVSSVTQLDTASPCTVRIQFTIEGSVPDLVQIYSGGRSDTPGEFIEAVPMEATQTSYSKDVLLQAGAALFIALCPRTETNGVPDDDIDGEPWESDCTFFPFTTQASPGPTPGPKPPTPFIGSIEPHQVTLYNPGRIDVHWSGIANFDLYHFMWLEKSIDWQETEINSGGSEGVFSLTPATAGLIYDFKVQGCISKAIGLDDCSLFSPPTTFPMPPNTRSLRTFLQLSGVNPTAGIRVLGVQNYGGGIRAMMHL